jgi:hypothetical protein
MGMTLVWTTAPNLPVPNAGEDTTMESSFVQLPGGSSCVFVYWPPANAKADPSFDAAKAAAEFKKLNPEIEMETEGGMGGMHATDSIDYVIVLEGEIYAVLDDGREEVLRKHDVLIQNGTRHAWKNKSDKPAKVASFSLGARRVPKMVLR